MKLKVFVIIVLELSLSACGGGSGSTTGEVNNSNSIPNNNSNNQEADIDIDEAEDYFELVGAPVTQTKVMPDLLAVVHNYQLEEYENNLNIKLQEGGDTALYSRSPTVNISNYTPVGSLEGYWSSKCINHKEDSVNTNGSTESVYHSKRFGLFFSEYQELMSVDVYKFNSLDCDPHFLDSSHDDGYSTLFTKAEIIGEYFQLTAYYEVTLNEPEMVELTHNILFSQDGNSMVIYDGDKTYTVYDKR
ncbi:MAG: hypothetical protein VX185_14110 [Pseudomonadota bacterium]|nr:hypothetical protein [Pseudomonadota bacterium]